MPPHVVTSAPRESRETSPHRSGRMRRPSGARDMPGVGRGPTVWGSRPRGLPRGPVSLVVIAGVAETRAGARHVSDVAADAAHRGVEFDRDRLEDAVGIDLAIQGELRCGQREGTGAHEFRDGEGFVVHTPLSSAGPCFPVRGSEADLTQLAAMHRAGSGTARAKSRQAAPREEDLRL